VAIKNSVDIFYFACIAPLHIFFTEEGAMEKKTFLGAGLEYISVPGCPQ
jgi:AP-1 complex subunit beta-1